LTKENGFAKKGIINHCNNNNTVNFKFSRRFLGGNIQFIRYSKAALSYYGSTGQEVKNIQYKLAIWKYYNGKIDGIYGYKTYMAVRKFQAKNGLKVTE